MLPALASIEALSEMLGVLYDPETTDGARAQSALDAASAWIRAEAGINWVDDAGDLDEVPDIIERIAIAAASRVMRNPDGATQKSVGDVSITFSTSGGGASESMLTKAEIRQVRKIGGVSGFGTIILESPHPLGWRDPLYVPVQGGGDWFPIGPLPWRDG